MGTKKGRKGHRNSPQPDDGTTKYKGSLYFTAGGKKEDAVIREAVVSEKRISCDWIEGGERAHLEAMSSDGRTFRGHYGYSTTMASDFTVELKKYDGDGEVLFFGTWYEHDVGDEGIWVFVLGEPD